MNKKVILLIFLILSLTLYSCKKEDNLHYEINAKELSEEEILDKKINSIISKMTTEEKISQMIILGFEGNSLNSDLENLILNVKPSGLVFFSRNIKDKEQIKKLNKDIINLNKDNLPLFLAVDEEGGIVSRLAPIYSKIPNMNILGNKNNLDLSYKYGKVLSLRLKTLGFNLDFAPVLDINSNKNNPVIGNRSFSSNKEIVSKNGLAPVQGLNSNNIISSVKHFPGHGDTSVDSHKDIPIVTKSKEEILNFEVYPFKNAIDNNIDMIMVGHILYTSLDSENIASLSKNVKEDFLREELKFNGVIISDDLTMNAVLKNKSIEEASYEFLKTGGDLALICHNTKNAKKTVDYILEKVKSKEFSEEEINIKVKRILKLKYKYNLENTFNENIELENELLNLQRELLNELK